jgi:predicted secreted hydrolase
MKISCRLFMHPSRFLGSLLLVFCCSAPATQNYRLALPGYHFSFPRDYFNHPDFQTEWWYYTGNVQSADGHKFGFELTFFRQAVARDPAHHTAWDVEDLYLAHLALSDLTAGNFYYVERTNRSGPGIAGVDEAAQRIWNGNWQIQWKNSDQSLQAVSEKFDLQFSLHPEKAPVINGENGVSQKAEGPGRASHYISVTRLATIGSITLNGKSFSVSGLAWMDHEFFTHQLALEQAGWDWMSLQLDDHSELMLFHIRRKGGSIDLFSAGTYVDAQGHTLHLRESDFVLQPVGDTWKSPKSGASYSVHWKISIAKLGIELEARTPLPSQELAGDSHVAPTYWEGAIVLTGKRFGAAIAGSGYLEMTGYAKDADAPI